MSSAIWPLDDLLNMSQMEFDDTVRDTREFVEDTRKHLKRLRDLEAMGGNAGDAIEHAERQLDDEVRNLQRMAFADSQRRTGRMV